MKKLFKLLIIILMHANLANGQEKADTLKITDGPKDVFMVHFNFEHAFDGLYPTIDPVITNQRMLYQVYEYRADDIQKYQYFATPFNAFYSYSNKGFSYFQNSVPFYTGFSFHLNEALDWKRIDLFVDGVGVMYNDYSTEMPLELPGTQQGFMWEAGIGAGYKINSKSTIFIKGAVLMNNMNRYGSKELGGMNVKF